MPVPATIDDFLDVVRKSKQIDSDRLDALVEDNRRAGTLPPRPHELAALAVRAGLMTPFQAEQFLQGKHRGFTLGGHRIIDRLGVGGTGAVYLGQHEMVKRLAAIKVLPPSRASEGSVALERFRREAQAGAMLSHPNVVRVYDFRQDGPLTFLVMEYVRGPSLEAMARGGALPVPAACEVIRQAALGLAHVHGAGLVHRDVKPGNLLVGEGGVVKLLDLGLARFPAGPGRAASPFDSVETLGTAESV